MKRTFRSRFVGIGIQRPEIVDKRPTFGHVTRDPDLIARQLRGEIDESGERYGKERRGAAVPTDPPKED